MQLLYTLGGFPAVGICICILLVSALFALEVRRLTVPDAHQSMVSRALVGLSALLTLAAAAFIVGYFARGLRG
jgi:hypothetical protein